MRMKIWNLVLVAAVAATLIHAHAAGTVTKKAFGKTGQGASVDLYTLKNSSGMEVTVTNYGGIVTSLKAPDRNGKFADIVLGFDSLDGYLKQHPYFGAIVGRYGNRIAKGRFKLNGTEYKLATNNGPNALHGGLKGFDKQLWNAKSGSSAEGAYLELTYLSKDGEEGYPGNLNVKVTYTLTDNNTLRIAYEATSDKDTVVNITNHSYFNLSGAPDILGHDMKLFASGFTPVDAGLIPTGEIRKVQGTPFDFTTPRKIGERINADYDQIKLGGGYDHNFVLDGRMGTLHQAAEVYEASTGRVLEVWTEEPGVQFYTGNFLDGTLSGKGRTYNKRAGFCLETQHFPDSPNQPKFPSTVVKPGTPFRSSTEWRFKTR